MVAAQESEVVARVRRALAAGDGAPLVLLVEGAAGTGKSRLAGRILAAAPDGAECAVLSAAAGPLLSVSPSGVAGLPGPSGVARLSGVAGVAGLSWVRTAPGAALLVVDDVQAADPPGRELLWETVRTARPGQVLVLAHRPEELPVSGLVLGRPLVPPPGAVVVRHRLGPLDPAAVRELATARLGAPPAGDGAVQLHRITGGVAQVVVDVLDALGGAGRAGRALTAGEVAALEPPPRLAELALARTAAVPAAYRPLVWAAAVLGGPVGAARGEPAGGCAGEPAGVSASAAELAEVAGLPEAAGREGLVLALETAALQELGPDTYGFAVPLAGQAVAASLPGPRRAALHRAAARVLAGRREPPWPSVAAQLEAGGEERGRLRAVERAIGTYLEARCHDEADRLLRRTLADRRLAAHSRARLAATAMGPLAAALPVAAAERLLGSIAGDPALPEAVRGQARISLALALCTPLPPDRERWLRLERAARELSGQPALAARVLSGMAIPHWPGATLAEHLHWLERAEATAATVREPALHAAVAANGVSLLLTVGEPRAGRHLAARPGPGEEPERLHHWVRGLSNAADAATWLGRYREARDWLDQSLAHPARRPAGRADSTVTLAGRSAALLLDWFTGRWTGLADRAEQLMAQVSGRPVLGTEAQLVLASLALARGDWQQVTERLLGPQVPSPDAQMVPVAAAASAVLIRLALARGEPEAARAEAVAAWARLRRKGIWAWAAELAPWAVAAALATGRTAEARRLTEEFSSGLRRLSAARPYPVPAGESAARPYRASAGDPAGGPHCLSVEDPGGRPYRLPVEDPAGQSCPPPVEEPADRAYLPPAEDPAGRPCRAAVGESAGGPYCVPPPAAEAAAHWCRAALAEAAGDHAGALAGYRASAAGYAALPRPYLAALAAEAAARCALATGDPAAGRAELEGAVRVLAGLGAVWDAARVRAALRLAAPPAAPPRRGRPPGAPGLSPREREVAELAGSGLTNREIADTLHLSPRTVEQHVSRAMRKLSAPSRRALTPLPADPDDPG
ncbi:LuxR C-terminal-related transcriptional regulator [Streptomyces sp. LP05-1]|uniref:LuxR C-terminal-related transcriptional regulator n=1 Tax=Streptomyces pyxinae TaxID=2970734 RepID=A0ABT2CLQ8_9ACTN|nr:LuxR C-terminal-related transcriptional regulator [Streptomyces sp. LP05-1]MCS0638349.1 LuxR C-terminal-related transcriptional regulator [Streptomyces sp. LP05-1]